MRDEHWHLQLTFGGDVGEEERGKVDQGSFCMN